MINRRKFLKTFSLGLVSLAILGSLVVPSFKRVIKGIIKDDLGSLDIDESIIDQFYSDAKNEGIWEMIFYNFQKREFLRVHYIFDNTFVNVPYYNKYLDFRSQIVGLFLLSTNYFIKQKSDNIQYLAIYNAYKRPCFNPFSAPYDQAWLS